MDAYTKEVEKRRKWRDSLYWKKIVVKVRKLRDLDPVYRA